MSSTALQEYRQTLTRLLWAPPVANAAALIACLQLLGNVEDPDFVFRALDKPIAILGIGAALGMCAILMGLLSLISDVKVENLQFMRTAMRDANLTSPANDARWDNFISRDARASAWREMSAVALAILSVGCLLTAGTWAYVSAHKGRLQPRAESSAPDRMIEVLNLLNELDANKPAPAPVTMPESPPAKAQP